jgi:dihydroorotase
MPGNPADLTIIDLARRCTVDAATFRSKSRNTPFEGWTLTGCAVLTLVGGRVVFDARS